MPYPAKSGQATAAFLNIKRTKGMAAAKAFGRKHAADLSAAAKARPRRGRGRSSGYMTRSDRDA